MCYKKNMFIGTNPTYLAVKPVTAFLIARHEAEAICTSGCPSPKAVTKGENERWKTYTKSFSGPPTLGVVLPQLPGWPKWSGG